MDILERFLKYVKIATPSSSISNSTPSTIYQHCLAQVLAYELKELGLEVIYDKEHCYVYGILKGNIEAPSIGFITHMDTSEDACGIHANPRITESYNGSTIKLENNQILDPNQYPDLKNHLNKTLITSDGTTLLGADDKAGIAEVMTMLEHFVASNDSHGDICVCFVPDEEISRDLDFFQKDKFPATYAYTVDGTDLGEISYENFNAASIDIKIKGTIAHLGYAKGILVNSLIIAHELYGMLPNETPANTEGHQGYYHLLDLEGNEEWTQMSFIIRDFNKEDFQKRKQTFLQLAELLNQKYGNKVELEIKDSYYNMEEIIKSSWHLVTNALKAMKTLHIKPLIKPIRGGTSGARLSYLGIPCPNLGVGGHNFHSYTEYITLEDMQKTSEILIEIVKEYAHSKDIMKLEKEKPSK